ncbi:MAG: ribose 5-phosphate isomerase B [Actinobacteria bacterium]|nr:ribose 5-phosphate isomerase B [Actinomycetota bacterium]
MGSVNRLKIGIGSDHAGFCYKEEIKKWLAENGYDVKDYGVFDEKSLLDYKCVKDLAEGVSAKKMYRGIVICGTGVAVSIVANKVKWIRAAVCNDIYTAIKSRQHNDLNILALGSRVVGLGHALEIVQTWLNTGFEGGRHSQRNKYIASLED